ncbi:hypothetical protein V2I49_20615, partial [Pseudomonas viridiflava]|nr:hypothetical protein [Pseudomonas viridiflava]
SPDTLAQACFTAHRTTIAGGGLTIHLLMDLRQPGDLQMTSIPHSHPVIANRLMCVLNDINAPWDEARLG